MIVALSRFKLANGQEEAVRGAFFDRSGSVDNGPGFLGLEVFKDTEDSSLFYLIARWTEKESFLRGHSAPDEEQARKGIPTQLKLDPSFTQFRTLERISGQISGYGEALHSDGVDRISQGISNFLARSTAVHWMKVRSDGVIVANNRAFARSIGGATEGLEGVPVWSLLTEPAVAVLRCALEIGSNQPVNVCRLSFVDRDHMPFTLECQVDVQPGGFVLTGEAVQQDELALQRELMTLNNRLAVLLRENERKTKALRRANAGLEIALKDLDESHWHLKKIQEVLPICMICGKVKTSDTNWEDVVEYLKQNSLFLSHGYCPTCLDKELTK